MKKKKEEKKEKAQSIQPRDIAEELRESYLDYAMSIIISRALPDVRDGLKPVQRRILFAMHELGLNSSSKSKKSAAVVGDTLAKYHPHGDIAVYDTLVRMAQDFSLRYPLIKGQGNFGCFTKDTKIRLCDGRSLDFENLIKEQKKGKKHWTFSFNHHTKKIEITEIKKPRLTKRKEKIIKIIIDNGENIKCTLNHRFMLRNGEYKEAKDLMPGDSLMPLYIKTYNGKDKNLKNYEILYQPIKGNWEFTHHLADEWNLRHKIYLKSAGRIRHHKDFNKFNNNPDNILRIQWQNHWQYHKEIASMRHNNDSEYVKKIAKGRKKFWSNKKNRKAYSKRMTERNLKNWKNKKYRKKMSITLSELNKKYYKEHPEAIERSSKTASATLKRLWKNPTYKKLFHEKIVASNKKRTSNLTGKKKFLRICHYLNEHNLSLTKTDFEKTRKEIFGTKSFTSWDWGIKKYYNNNPKSLLYEIDNNHIKVNHKIIKTRILRKREDVYDLTIDSLHNFSLAAGIFVHNSIDGDPPAAMRYTEVKLTPLAEEMLEDLDKETVDFIPNYDGTKTEPKYLPAKLPQLILNGTMGIAVGMATNIPPHNLKEVADALIYLIDHPRASVEDLMNFIKGPDFPTGGIIFGKQNILEAYANGKGKIICRAKTEIVEDKIKKIIITEIPYQVNKADLITHIAHLAEEKKIEGIKDLRDESDKEGLKIVVELKNNVAPKRILNQLFKFTSLEKNFHLNMLALTENGLQPQVLSVKDILEEYVAHRKNIIKQRTEYLLKKAKERTHILEGLSKALNHIDNIIKLIKASENKEDAQKKLITKYHFSEIQANAILEMKLQNLAKLERKKLEQELAEKQKLIKEYTLILKEPKRISNIIKKEIKILKEKYGDERRTEVRAYLPEAITEEQLIPSQETLIAFSQNGYIKRFSPNVLRGQKRGGKGVTAYEAKNKEDILTHLISCNTRDEILFFTDKGRLFKLRAFEIIEAPRTSRGKTIQNYLNLNPEEKIIVLLNCPSKQTEITPIYLLMATERGIIKKSLLKEYDNIRKGGIIALKLMKNDKLIGAALCNKNDEIILATNKGQSIRFSEKDVRAIGRSASGVIGIKLSNNDNVISLIVVKAKEEKTKKQILVVSENGFGKRTNLKEYRKQKRGGYGIKTIKITAKTGSLIKSCLVEGEESIIAISQKGQILKAPLAGIPILRRSTQGVRIMRLEQEDKIAAITLL